MMFKVAQNIIFSDIKNFEDSKINLVKRLFCIPYK